jgi:3-oxoacyl-[acyl-carrier-protein] synthase II
MAIRVVITGLGAVTPLGDVEAIWRALLGGETRFAPRQPRHTDPLARPPLLQAFSDAEWRDLEAGRTSGRVGILAAIAAQRACVDAGLSDTERRSSDLVFATTSVGWPSGEADFRRYHQRGAEGLDAGVARSRATAATEAVAAALALRDVYGTFSAACASGGLALGYAADLIQAGVTRRVLVGGADALADVPLLGFANLRIVSAHGCRPLSHDRDGMTLSEGGAFLILEAQDEARAAGRQPYAEILGAGGSCDANHMTRPHAPGVLQAMRQALAEAALAADDLGAINAHATGTRANDAEEATAILALYPLASPPVTAIKSVIGHMQGAAGVFASLVTCLMIRSGQVPPVRGFSRADDPRLTVAAEAQTLAKPFVLTNCFGFGGANSSIVMGAAP